MFYRKEAKCASELKVVASLDEKSSSDIWTSGDIVSKCSCRMQVATSLWNSRDITVLWNDAYSALWRIARGYKSTYQTEILP